MLYNKLSKSGLLSLYWMYMYMCYSAGSDGGPGTLLSTQLTDKQKFLAFSYSKVQCEYI